MSRAEACAAAYRAARACRWTASGHAYPWQILAEDGQRLPGPPEEQRHREYETLDGPPCIIRVPGAPLFRRKRDAEAARLRCIELAEEAARAGK